MSKHVKLNISTKAKTSRGWHEVKASNGKLYWYKYNDGNWGGGNGNNKFKVPEKGEKAASQTFTLKFKGSDYKTYKFVSYRNKNKPSDLSGVVNGNNLVTIIDKCAIVGDFNWGVTVAVKVKVKDGDTTSPVTFECDPMVRNIFS